MTEFTYDNYREVLEYEFQQEEKQPKTFLQIAKQPHYENVISNILAFFFDTSEEHNLKDLFLQSLVHLINKKEYSFEMSDCHCQREHRTQKSGRIDMLLINRFEDKVIIIENKINHYLGNDLGSYHKTVIQDYPKADVAGVVLSLEPLNTRNDNFISITHRKLVDEVQKRLGSYYLNGSDKYLLLLKDYIQNINLNYTSDAMKDKVSFFHNHHKKIHDILLLQDDIIKYLGSEIKKAGDRFNYKYSDTDGILVYLDFLDNQSLMKKQFSYFFDLSKIVSGENLGLKINLTLEDTDKIKLIKKAFKDKDRLEKKYPYIRFAETQNDNNWVDFAWKSYELSEQNMLNLTDFLYDVVQKDFEPLKDELLTILTKTQK